MEQIRFEKIVDGKKIVSVIGRKSAYGVCYGRKPKVSVSFDFLGIRKVRF